MNRIYGSDVLIGARTFQLVHESMELRPMEMIYDPESEVMTEVYELLSLSESFTDEDRQCRDTFWEAVIHYREKEYDKALEKFSWVRQSGRTGAGGGGQGAGIFYRTDPDTFT